MNNFTWTDERVERLKKLWADGLSCSQIAAALGGALSRNAVTGKIHRLGLGGRIKANSVPPRPRVKRQQSGGNTHKLFAVMRQADTPAPELEPDEIIIENPVTFAGLELEHCRWPIGDGAAIMFCGSRRYKDRSYCPHHCGRAYDLERTRRTTEHDKQAIADMRRAIAERAI